MRSLYDAGMDLLLLCKITTDSYKTYRTEKMLDEVINQEENVKKSYGTIIHVPCSEKPITF
jgi:hypothetical protein